MITGYNNNTNLILTFVYLYESLTAIFRVSTSKEKETKHTKLKTRPFGNRIINIITIKMDVENAGVK